VPWFVSPEAAVYGKALLAGAKAAGLGVDAYRPAFEKIHGPEPKATLKQVADHIDHVARVAGHDHVGISADYGGASMPVGLEDTASYPALFAELIRRGWNDDHLRKLAGRNLIRTLRKAETVAAKLQKNRKPSLATT
jgi:membrane dipeptidase